MSEETLQSAERVQILNELKNLRRDQGSIEKSLKAVREDVDKIKSEQKKDPVVHHLDSGLGCTLTVFAVIGVCIFILDTLKLQENQIIPYLGIALVGSFVIYNLAWGLVSAIVGFVAHALWAFCLAANTIYIAFMLHGIEFFWVDFESITSAQWENFFRYIFVLFCFNVLFFVSMFTFAKTSRVEPA